MGMGQDFMRTFIAQVLSEDLCFYSFGDYLILFPRTALGKFVANHGCGPKLISEDIFLWRSSLFC